MPKTTKKVFTYFRFETDHFYDTKVKRLKNKFGMEDWGVFHFIVNEIYRVEGCYNSIPVRINILILKYQTILKLKYCNIKILIRTGMEL